jgi:formamidopyrimidine-DNA glycosylase
MNQQLLAGIGNVYSDEILFGAGVHPASALVSGRYARLTGRRWDRQRRSLQS